MGYEAKKTKNTPQTDHHFRFTSFVFKDIFIIFRKTHIMSFWSSATDPNKDSCSKCQETSSTTAVCPVKMVLASTTFPSLGTALISHRQIVCRKYKNCTYHKKHGKSKNLCKLAHHKVNAAMSATHMIIRCTKQISTEVRIPRQSIAFLLVTTKPKIWITLS